MFEEIFESPAFWMLGGGGIIAELLGWIISRRAGWESLPFWQLLIIMVGTLIAAAFFCDKRLK